MVALERSEMLAIVETWPVEEQISFAHEVWERIETSEDDPTMSEELKTELERRLAAHDANPSSSIPWEEVKAKALTRLRK